MPNFAGNPGAQVRVSSMEAQASAIARNQRRPTETFEANREIPKDVWDAMAEQGMTNQNMFAPGAPIAPTEPVGSKPRQFEYMIGQNIVQRPRSMEDVSFDTMRSIIEMYDVAQMAIEVRQDELRNLEWDIVPDDEDEADKYASEIKQVREFFEHPNEDMLFDDFQNMLSYDWLAFDALTLYPEMTRGGKLNALYPVDGTTITPMIDIYGHTPNPPAPAYVEWMYGLPYVWLTRDGLIYRPHRRRTNKLYGYAPVEWLLNNINTDIRYQLYFLQYFTDGSIPDSWINAPEGMQDPEKIKQFQRMYDSVMNGDQTMRHKAKFIPFGSKVTQAKEAKFDINFPQFMLNKTCAAWKVTPAELGFTEKVNKSSGETQENVQYRRSIKPSAKFFESIYTGIIHKYFKYLNLRFKFLNIEEQEDRLLMAQSDQIYIQSGVVSPDEVRVARYGYDVDNDNPVPRIFMNNRQITPVQTALKQSDLAEQQLEAQVKAEEVKSGTQVQDPMQDGEEDDSEASQEEQAQKAAKDFFFKASGDHPNPHMQKWIDHYRPEVHKFLTNQRWHYMTQIKKKLERANKVMKEANQKPPPQGMRANPAPEASTQAGQTSRLTASQASAEADAILQGVQSPTWEKELQQLLQDMLVNIYMDSHDKAVGQVSAGFKEPEAPGTFHFHAEQYRQERTANLVTRLDESTKDMLKTTLRNGMEEGKTPKEIERDIEHNYAFSESRAQTIARTETGFAWNHAGIKTYQTAGAKGVRVYDGDYDPECADADGEVWGFDYAMGHTLQHPNCVRSFGPEMEDVELDRGTEMPSFVSSQLPKESTSEAATGKDES